MKKNHLLTGTTPTQWLSADQVAELARRSEYQPKRLAAELGLASRTFERRFQRAFECAPRQWLTQLRMRDGVALLERGFSTKEVAAELGFRDRSSLFRVFRLQLRPTPRKLASRLGLTGSAHVTPPGMLSQTATFLSQTATPPGLRLTEAL